MMLNSRCHWGWKGTRRENRALGKEEGFQFKSETHKAERASNVKQDCLAVMFCKELTGLML